MAVCRPDRCPCPSLSSLPPDLRRPRPGALPRSPARAAEQQTIPALACGGTARLVGHWSSVVGRMCRAAAASSLRNVKMSFVAPQTLLAPCVKGKRITLSLQTHVATHHAHSLDPACAAHAGNRRTHKQDCHAVGNMLRQRFSRVSPSKFRGSKQEEPTPQPAVTPKKSCARSSRG